LLRGRTTANRLAPAPFREAKTSLANRRRAGLGAGASECRVRVRVVGFSRRTRQSAGGHVECCRCDPAVARRGPPFEAQATPRPSLSLCAPGRIRISRSPSFPSLPQGRTLYLSSSSRLVSGARSIRQLARCFLRLVSVCACVVESGAGRGSRIGSSSPSPCSAATYPLGTRPLDMVF
jgi:hypothetical protein